MYGEGQMHGKGNPIIRWIISEVVQDQPLTLKFLLTKWNLHGRWWNVGNKQGALWVCAKIPSADACMSIL